MFIYRQRTFSKVIIFFIILTIFLGTVFLALPVAQVNKLSLLDCLFTSASCVSVTGILTVPINSFSLFGKIVIMILIQLGGIGLITLYLFLFTIFSSKLAITTRFMIGRIFDLESVKNIRQALNFIILFTLFFESIGALLIYLVIKSKFNTFDAIFNSIFHSISSFCSAGLISSLQMNNLLKENIYLLTITGILILAGTLGFITFYDLFLYLKNRLIKKKANISLTTKVILSSTFYLIILFFLILVFLEKKNIVNIKSIFNILFNAISYRSTGFSTIDLNSANLSTIFLILIYGFIGSSPGSAGGGIKVTTFAIFISTIKSLINNKNSVEIKLRRVPQDEVLKTFVILTLSFSWILFSTFLLLVFENSQNFSNIFFEIISTFSTLGIATETTPLLSNSGKLLIILNMIIGRIGTLTVLNALQRKVDKSEFNYPEEKITIN